MKKIVNKIMNFAGLVSKNRTGAYAAQSAYFFMLSLIPIILLLLAIVQYTPVTKADVMTAAVLVFPEESMQSFIVGIVNQVYNQSQTVIPITALVALWSAGKGVLAMNTGLNCVYEIRETRNYFILRIRASIYTFVFIVAIVVALVLSVFGNSISIFVSSKFPIFEETMAYILQMRTVISFFMMLGFSLLIYRFLPNRKDKIKYQLPGAVFTSIGWLLISFIFSMYLTIFKGFSGLYGSMTAIILVMLWLYFCMYVMLLGGIINRVWQEKNDL
ncbi:YihY/virulence factor BrkB family protein [Roseburia hominis]